MYGGSMDAFRQGFPCQRLSRRRSSEARRRSTTGRPKGSGAAGTVATSASRARVHWWKGPSWLTIRATSGPRSGEGRRADPGSALGAGNIRMRHGRARRRPRSCGLPSRRLIPAPSSVSGAPKSCYWPPALLCCPPAPPAAVRTGSRSEVTPGPAAAFQRLCALGGRACPPEVPRHNVGGSAALLSLVACARLDKHGIAFPGALLYPVASVLHARADCPDRLTLIVCFKQVADSIVQEV